MKPTIYKRKDTRGRIVSYRAALGPLEGTGPDAKHASEALELELMAALDRLKSGPMIGTWREHTYIIMPSAYGWSYWLDVLSRDSRIDDRGDRHEVKESALRHLAQIVWTHDVEDDRAFVEGLPGAIVADLLGYFNWQREYKRLSSKGYTDTETRNIIAGFQKEEE